MPLLTNFLVAARRPSPPNYARRFADGGLVRVVAMSLVFMAADLPAQEPVRQRISRRPANTVELELREVFRVGSLDGPNDAFGRVMSATIDSRGRLFIADDRRQRIVVFDAGGSFIRSLGRPGRGPGEFQSPWLVAADPTDSIFVWDQGTRTISVFDPGLAFTRSFRVPPQWLVSSLKFLPNGHLVLAAFGRNERHGIQVLDRDGNPQRAFLPVPSGAELGGYESSLLGGTLDVAADGSVVYSRKSPYEILLYTPAGRLRAQCVGDPAMTTPPADVVQREPLGIRLNWARYTHSTSVVSLGGGFLANTITDPVNDIRVVDIVDQNCRLLRRTRVQTALTLIDRRGSRVVARSDLDFPEVVVYSMQLRQR